MKAKFNAIDALIIIAVIAVIAVGILYFKTLTPGNTGSGTASKGIVQIELANEDEYLTELPKEGDEVTIGVREKARGTVSKVTVEPAETVAYDLSSGAANISVIPDKYDIYIDVAVDAVDTGSQIEVDGVPLRVGVSDAIRSRGWAGYGYITGVDLESEEDGSDA